MATHPLPYVEPWWLKAARKPQDDHQRAYRPGDRSSYDRKRKKHRKAPAKFPATRDYKAAIMGMLAAYDRLGDVLAGEQLDKARALFVTWVEDAEGEVTMHHFPDNCRRIVDWREPVAVAADPQLKPPWED